MPPGAPRRGPADPADLAARTAGWATEQYWPKSEERAYRTVRPGLLVEEFIGEPGAVPADHVLGGPEKPAGSAGTG